MLTNNENIKTYTREHFGADDVFILLELKDYVSDGKLYNYDIKGKPRNVLMATAEIVDAAASKMGISFDDAIEVMKQMHMISSGKYRARTRRKLENMWEDIEL